MIRRLHHVGLVVPDIHAALARFAQLPGVLPGEPFEVPESRYLLAYVDLGNCMLELTQPLSADTVAGRLLAVNPAGGLNHLAFEVDELLATRDEFVAMGAIPMGPAAPRIDRSGTRVVVLDATDALGTLVELRQPFGTTAEGPLGDP